MDDAGDLLGGFDRRVTRQEEWAKLDDGRMDRLEVKFDRLVEEMANFRAEIRASMVTKAELVEERRHGSAQLWVSVGVIIAAVGVIVGVFQLSEAKSSRPLPSPAPMVIQLPAQPAPTR